MTLFSSTRITNKNETFFFSRFLSIKTAKKICNNHWTLRRRYIVCIKVNPQVFSVIKYGTKIQESMTSRLRRQKPPRIYHSLKSLNGGVGSSYAETWGRCWIFENSNIYAWQTYKTWSGYVFDLKENHNILSRKIGGTVYRKEATETDL